MFKIAVTMVRVFKTDDDLESYLGFLRKEGWPEEVITDFNEDGAGAFSQTDQYGGVVTTLEFLPSIGH